MVLLVVASWFQKRYVDTGWVPGGQPTPTPPAGTVSRVTIEHLGTGRPPVDARSMLALISSGIQAGDPVRITADGTDKASTLARIDALLETGVCHP